MDIEVSNTNAESPKAAPEANTGVLPQRMAATTQVTRGVSQAPVAQVAAAKAAGSGAKTLLIVIITIVSTLAIGGLGVLAYIIYGKISNQDFESTEAAPAEVNEMEPIEPATELEEIIEEVSEEPEEEVFDVAEDNVTDYLNSQVKDKEKYNFYKSTVSGFKFGYPGSLFSSKSEISEKAEGHYGTIEEEVLLSGSDGSFANFVLTKRTDALSISNMMEDAYFFESKFITDKVELLNESRGSYAEVVLRGYNDDSRTTTVFNLTHITDDYVMQMKLYCPKAEDEAIADAIEDYYQNMYESCGFARIKLEDYGRGREADPSDSQSAKLEDDSVGYSEYGWSAAYCEYMNKLAAANREYDFEYAALVYINADDIPELILGGMYEAVGNEILTYKNGKIDVLITDRLDFDFIERKNILRNATSSGSYYCDNVYCIKNGKWKALQEHNGDVSTYQESKYDDIFNEAYENDTVCYDYEKEDFTSMWDYLLYIDE